MPRCSSVIILSLGLALFFPCLPSLADVDAGVTAFEHGDYAKAIDEWRIDAAQGNANALFNLGQAYRLGKGVPVDLDQAETYYQRAARAGHPAAMGNLATLYYFSKKPPMVDEAVHWWELGARAGDPRSQYILGAMTFNGDAVPKDLKRAFAWTWLASRAGLAEAKSALTTMEQYVPKADQEAAKDTATQLMSSEGLAYWKGLLPQEQVASAGDETANDAAAGPGAKEEPANPPSPAPAAAASDETKAATTATDVADGAVEAAEPPTPAPVTPKTATTPATATPQYRVNLASLGSRASAEALWQEYVKEHGDIFSGLTNNIAETEVGGRTLFRLQVGAYATAADAQAACNGFKQAGLACFVLKAAD